MLSLNPNIYSLITTQVPNAILESKISINNYASQWTIYRHFVTTAELINNSPFVNNLIENHSSLKAATIQGGTLLANGYLCGIKATTLSPEALANLGLGYLLSNNVTDFAFFTMGLSIGLAHGIRKLRVEQIRLETFTTEQALRKGYFEKHCPSGNRAYNQLKNWIAAYVNPPKKDNVYSTKSNQYDETGIEQIYEYRRSEFQYAKED